MDKEIIAWLALRIVFAWMYIYPIVSLLQDRKGMIAATGLLFKWHSEFFAYASLLIMVMGAISILFGIYAQIGGLLLLIFTLGGTIIHYRLAKQAQKAAAFTNTEKLAKLAMLGHVSSAQKNYVLAAVALFFLLLGSGPYSFTGNLF